MTYFDHNDKRNADARARVRTHADERQRQARAAAECDAGCITLWMSSRDIEARLLEAHHLRARGTP